MPVTGGQPVDVMGVEAFALKAGVKEILVLVQMFRVGGIDHLDLADRVAQPIGGEFLGHIRLAPHDQRAAKARAGIGDRRLSGRGHRRPRQRSCGPGRRGRGHGCLARWWPSGPCGP